MKQARELFTEEDKKKIAEAVAKAEEKTSGEIVPVAATVSGRYDRAEDIVGALTAIIILGVAYLCSCGGSGEWVEGQQHGGPGFIATAFILLIGFPLGAVAATMYPVLRRPFIPETEKQQEVERQAGEAFHRFRLRSTEGSTGILIYVSMEERMVRILGDDAISEKLNQSHWEEVCALVTGELREERYADAFIKGIERAGELLAEHFPIEPGDTNELPNELKFIDS